MAADLTTANATLLEFERLVEEGAANTWTGELKVGVDLGTANILVSVTDAENRPVAGVSTPSRVVRDGIVVDYVGAIQTVRSMKARLEENLGVRLTKAACAIPPGISSGNTKAIGNVVEAADFRLTRIVDEPTAAASVLGIKDGAVVDVGGGTTGISILKDGEVIFTADEPTGGTHMTLVLAGFKRISTDEAELIKKDRGRESEVFPIIRPVVDKMASIVAGAVRGYEVDTIYVVGGACCFSEFAGIFEKRIGIPTVKPAAPLLVTPLGIAMNA
ncbi:MAG: ethanolamine utilization protein EutJ [Synergistaceae bacterium]|nr:ethanolamine utilization protein EutJ [Synergistaceae bacterium]